jgi:hypothetical protein
MRWINLIFSQKLMKVVLVNLILVACVPSIQEQASPANIVAKAATLPVQATGVPESPGETPAHSPSPAPVSLTGLAEARRIDLWPPTASGGEAHPITTEVLNNRATYGAFVEMLLLALDGAAVQVEQLRGLGVSVLVEVRWNGVSSYTDNTEVVTYLRDAGDTESKLWVQDRDGGFRPIEVRQISSIITGFPGSPPLLWQDPGRLYFADDPKDILARGLHVLDAVGRPVALWDHALQAFRPWIRDRPYRAKLANGFDIALLGFSDADLDLLWEAFHWIDLGLEEAGSSLAKVVTIRRSDLPAWVAGVGGRGDIRLDPQSFTTFREVGYPRQADVIWMAELIVHEVAHVNQPGECTPSYAASRGMTFQEYGLYLETGPGQAYEQEAHFLETVLDLRDENGALRLVDEEVRAVLEFQVSYLFDTLGKATFPDGTPVPTCADGG